MFKFSEWKRQLLMSKATSRVEQEKYEFEWRLKNVREFLKIQDRIESPIFVGGPKSLHQWRLVIAKSTRENDNSQQLFLSLKLVKFGTTWKNGEEAKDCSFLAKSSFDSGASSSSTSGSGVKAAFKVTSVGGASFDTPIIDEKQRKEFKEGTDLGVYISPASLLVSESLDNGKNLRLRCEILFEGQIKHGLLAKDQNLGNLKAESSAMEKTEFFVSQLTQRAENWATILNSGAHSDVSIVTKTKTIPAHKVVLSAHSPVFGAMFLSEMAESVQNTVKIQDFDDNIVNLMLQQMYCGMAENPQQLKENAMDLFRIADKYEIGFLKGACELTILENLSVENAMDVLTLAHFHSPTSLKPKMAGFLKVHQREIQQTDSFKKTCKAHSAVIADFNLLFLG